MLRRLLAVSFGLAACAQAATIRVPGDQPTIQAGIDAAAERDTVLVAPGTYTGAGNRNLDFGGVDRVLMSEEGADATVIDCEGEGRGFYFHSGETADTWVDGFSIIGGSSNPGGGVYCDLSSPTLRNCRIVANTNSGVRCDNSSPSLLNCAISGNAAGLGGGISCVRSSPMLENCEITLNVCSSEGGGIYCAESSPYLANCTITGNVKLDFGGGCGGISCWSRSYPMITNCIVWGNNKEQILAYASYPTVAYCDVQGWWPGEGNIDADPRFRHELGFDYVLSPGSPCIDSGTGDDDGIDWSALHSGYGRVNTQAPDMGAYGGPGNVGWLP